MGEAKIGGKTMASLGFFCFPKLHSITIQSDVSTAGVKVGTKLLR